MHDRAATATLPIPLHAAAQVGESAPHDSPARVAAPSGNVTPAPSLLARSRHCLSCGYNLHGLPSAALCPECGHDPSESPLPRGAGDADLWWARSVVCGLVLLLVTSFLMLGVTVYMHFRSEWAGSLPVLNFPGPKLWGTALLQRSIGSAPGEWGVAGTRYGLIGLLALWLITTPRPADRLGEPVLSLRILTRWVSLLGFGAMLGLLLGEDGVRNWESGERDVYFMLLVSLVELPATTLLYLYLRQIAVSFADPPLRRALNILAIAVPACIGAAVVFLVLGDVWQQAKHQLPQQIMVAGYGAACVAAAALATAAVGRMALLLVPAATGSAAPLGIRQFVLDVYRQAKLRALTQSKAWFGWVIAAGLIGWVLISVSMLHTVLRLEFRTGLGGNWPMVNVIAPKIWAVPMVERFDSFQARTTEVLGAALLMVLCIWMVTVRRPGPDESWRSPRRLARWGVTILVGCALGLVVGFGREAAVVRTASIYSSFTLPLTMFVEAPATLLLYLYLSVLARGEGDERLARHLSWAGLLAVALILGGNGLFALSRSGVSGGALAYFAVASYGLACVAVGLWATWSVLRLIRLLALHDGTSAYRQLSLFEG